MKFRIIIFLLLFVPFAGLSAQQATLKGKVYDKNEKPLEGVLIFWEDTQNSVRTDKDGNFEIKGTAHDHMLHALLFGYEEQVQHVHDKSQQMVFVLKDKTELEEVVISKSLGRYSSSIDVMKTEYVTTRELTRAACCSLSESFETNPSVDVSYSDAVTGAKQIQLLGLSGTYIQMLTENFPNFRGAAKLYGLDYVPGPWMSSILVSKGAASVKNGYESISGQVDVEYKKPAEADPLSLNVFFSDASRFEANADGAIKVSDKLYTGVFAHYSQEKKEHDDNNDTFLDMPKRHQLNLMNRWHYQSDNFISQTGVKFVNDDRLSGQTMHTLASHNGHIEPYEIDVETNRLEFFTKNGFILNPDKEESTAIIITGSYHDQKSKYAATDYNVYQSNLYGSWMYEKSFTPMHKISTGISYNWDKFDETKRIANLTNAGNMPSEESVAGVYGQYTLTLKDKWTFLAGVRADYSSVYDLFVTPRLHVKYNVTDKANIRLSAGKGYRSVFVLPENSFLLASNRKINIANDLKQEEAWNYGISASWNIPINNEDLALSAEYFYTDFNNQVVVDMENPTEVNFYNLNGGKSYSNSFQVEASYPFFRGFTLLTAFRLNDTKTRYANGETLKKPMVSDYKALATASYETKLRKWQFDLTAQFNGGGRMPTPAKNAVGENLWSEKFKPFTVLNAQITKFFRDWNVYVGAENLLNFTQKNPIIAASEASVANSNFDATMVYGPTQGTKFYIGARYTIGK